MPPHHCCLLRGLLLLIEHKWLLRALPCLLAGAPAAPVASRWKRRCQGEGQEPQGFVELSTADVRASGKQMGHLRATTAALAAHARPAAPRRHPAVLTS